MVTTGKEFMDEICKFLNLWTNNTPLKNIALTAIQVVSALLLQKPSKTSNAKKRQFKNIRKKSEIMRRWEHH